MKIVSLNINSFGGDPGLGRIRFHRHIKKLEGMVLRCLN